MTNDQKELLGVHFQDDQMKRAFDAYPEILFIDATYKLLELQFPLYIILIEDGNGQSEIASAFLLLEETETSLSKIMSIFKEYNPSWTATRVLMADKDMTERDVLASNFPNADLLICLYHTLRSFRREISCEKMGITSGQRTLYLELLQQMAYATNEVKYAELYSRFKTNAPAAVIDYFNKQWHPIRKQWTMGMKYSTGNFLNATNNRLESLNAKLKSVIPRFSSMETFTEKFFVILRVLWSERDHNASLSVLKVPTAFHSTSDEASKHYMRCLTPYAYKFVKKQMDMIAKVALKCAENQQYHVSSSEGNITVTATSCQCLGWLSMRLPCRHILSARADIGMSLFNEELCDKRWTLHYFKSMHRVFSKDFASNQSTVSLVTSSLRKTHNSAQPLSQVCITWLELQQHCLQYALVQFQKFKLVSRVTNKLSTLASEDSGLTLTKRLELLKQLVTAWENGETVALVNGKT
ncbi:zinc finger SWIM domain-containing protein 1-like [Corticium candelabrum]|uniref:zinc finger SWIM domain-containing protein 1-like n=1 Tax=Corticium candelabrum TaxID=121492 RepID=UPI002E270B3A|nr:zinc finger SWIM domain-containing protein 1-like [Corticium candelabrum]